MIVLTLPMPISSNRYWHPVKLGKHISIVPTKEAKQYRVDMANMARVAGVKAPILGRIKVEIWMYPHRPLDWQKRMQKHGELWDDSVRALDLDNITKTLLDSLKGVCFEDDDRVFQLVSQRMEPDDKGARVVVRITPIKPENKQEVLL